jgi:hypothetical protein
LSTFIEIKQWKKWSVIFGQAIHQSFLYELDMNLPTVSILSTFCSPIILFLFNLISNLILHCSFKITILLLFSHYLYPPMYLQTTYFSIFLFPADLFPSFDNKNILQKKRQSWKSLPKVFIQDCKSIYNLQSARDILQFSG